MSLLATGTEPLYAGPPTFEAQSPPIPNALAVSCMVVLVKPSDALTKAVLQDLAKSSRKLGLSSDSSSKLRITRPSTVNVCGHSTVELGSSPLVSRA